MKHAVVSTSQELVQQAFDHWNNQVEATFWLTKLLSMTVIYLYL